MSEGHFNGWIGVDFDGTLVEYDRWRGPEHIGAAITVMVLRVRHWLHEGRDVRIFTARVYAPNDNPKKQCEAAIAMRVIQDWCLSQFGTIIPVTCVKDFGMIELWDDRCVQVEPNTGRRVDGTEAAAKN